MIMKKILIVIGVVFVLLSLGVTSLASEVDIIVRDKDNYIEILNESYDDITIIENRVDSNATIKKIKTLEGRTQTRFDVKGKGELTSITHNGEALYINEKPTEMNKTASKTTPIDNDRIKISDNDVVRKISDYGEVRSSPVVSKMTDNEDEKTENMLIRLLSVISIIIVMIYLIIFKNPYIKYTRF